MSIYFFQFSDMLRFCIAILRLIVILQGSEGVSRRLQASAGHKGLGPLNAACSFNSSLFFLLDSFTKVNRYLVPFISISNTAHAQYKLSQARKLN